MYFSPKTADILKFQILTCMYCYARVAIMYVVFCLYHLVQTAHDNSLVLSYGGQGSDPHLPSTK